MVENRMRAEQYLSALSYAASAFAIIMFNKVVLSTYDFKSPIFMTFSHMSICLFFSVFLKLFGYIDYPDFQLSTLIRVIPLSLCFVLNIILGLMSTKLVSVPIMTTLRRLTALFIIAGEFIFIGKNPTSTEVLPVFVMLVGAFMTGWGDLTFEFYGYLVVLSNDLITATYLILLKKIGIQGELGKFGTLFYNALICAPLLACFCILHGDFDYVLTFEAFRTFQFQACFLSSGLLAFFVNMSVVWCTQSNSALTTSVTGQTKNILTTIGGIILFYDYRPSLLANSGVCVSICGSMWYAYNKYESKAKTETATESEIERLTDENQNGQGEGKGKVRQQSLNAVDEIETL